ncbi:non-homologous end-joining DNA ligase [Maribacter sp. CXY002]|uniref:non-homologous end-joining DNA ligase n=1 Tax=Maribacter luteocoastalis TaxID=3407671 RepID=UPI003B67D644
MALMGNIIEISHADKVLFPLSGITKTDLYSYYNEIAKFILPYLKDRPLTIHRFPEGIGKVGFYQKNASDYFPDWIQRAKVKKKNGWVNHVVCNSKETLLYLVNQGVITFHIGLSKIDMIDYPDKIIFDLDPPGNDFKPVVKGALIIREFLESRLGLSSMVMTTGSRGLHLVIPIKRRVPFDVAREFTKKIAKYLSFIHPKEFTTTIRKEHRKGLLFIDYLRNSYAQTAVCPFSVRALERAPVALPLSWEELNSLSLTAKSFPISKVLERPESQMDPWASNLGKSQSLDNPIHFMEELANKCLEIK